MTTLYRFYDAGGALLYVGIAEDWRQRLKTHSYQAPWFEQARHLVIQHWPDRALAHAAELEAIRTEWPLWNVNSSPWKTGEYLQRELRRRQFNTGYRVWRPLYGAAAASRNARVWREIGERYDQMGRLADEREVLPHPSTADSP